MPFSTMLLADYITYRLALAVYWLNIVLLGALLYTGGRNARRARLIKDDVTTEMTAASERRIIAYQRGRRCTPSGRCCRCSVHT